MLTWRYIWISNITIVKKTRIGRNNKRDDARLRPLKITLGDNTVNARFTYMIRVKVEKLIILKVEKLIILKFFEHLRFI